MALLVMLVFQVVFFYNWFKSAGGRDEKAPKESVEVPIRSSGRPNRRRRMATGTPRGMPNVYRGPYEYSHPDREEDYWPQTPSWHDGSRREANRNDP